jgi:hypothetical protein
MLLVHPMIKGCYDLRLMYFANLCVAGTQVLTYQHSKLRSATTKQHVRTAAPWHQADGAVLTATPLQHRKQQQLQQQLRRRPRQQAGRGRPMARGVQAAPLLLVLLLHPRSFPPRLL